MPAILNRCLILNTDNEFEPVYCCETQKQQLTLQKDERTLLTYFGDSFYLDATESSYSVKFCPWCGKRLINSESKTKKFMEEKP